MNESRLAQIIFEHRVFVICVKNWKREAKEKSRHSLKQHEKLDAPPVPSHVDIMRRFSNALQMLSDVDFDFKFQPSQLTCCTSIRSGVSIER